MADAILLQPKTCTKCGAQKPLEEFQKRKGSPDGHRGQCKACRAAKNSEYCRRWKEKDIDRYKAAVKRSNDNFAEKKKAWVEANREKLVAYTQKWRKANPEKYEAMMETSKGKFAKYRKEWKRANPDLVRAQVHVRRARKIGNGGEHTGEQLAELFESQKCRCANPYCRIDLRAVKKELDHKEPLALGGSSAIENLQWLCAPCNRRKHAKPMDGWLAAEERRSRKAA
jgi:hypothetical protein